MRSAKTASSLSVRVLGLLLGLKRPGNTDGATLNTCCLNARVSLAWTALWQLPFFGRTSFGCVLRAVFWIRPICGGVASGVSFHSCPRCCCHGLSSRSPARPCRCPGPSLPLAHEVALFGSCRSAPAWCVVLVCTRQPPTASTLARSRLPAWSSACSWLLCLRTGSAFAPVPLPAPAPVLHVSAPVRRGAVADARLGLALCSICSFVWLVFCV